MRKVYYEIIFKTESAMNIGCGVNDNSDRDVLRDGAGHPFIPGSTMAGIYRSLFDASEDTKKYFGYVFINTKVAQSTDQAIESKIKIYDANPDGKYSIKKRDCVGLDEYRTAKKGAKFDFEVVEPGVQFETFIEQDIDEESLVDIGKIIVSKWKLNGLSFGSKTMRGLGRTSLVSVRRCEFDLNTASETDRWVDFDMYDQKDRNWVKFDDYEREISDENGLHFQNGKSVSIKLGLKQKNSSGISVRQYTTDVSDGEKTIPDYVQLTSQDEGVKKPVIPGTSWAGSFKHHMEELLTSVGIAKEKVTDETEIWFGTTSKRSSIGFSESIIKGAESKVISRNAIDRFSGGTVDGALYTEEYYYGGTTDLTISVPCGSNDDKLLRCLVASIFDLHFGLMAVGGLSSVGRGLFEIKEASIAGESVTIPNPESASEVFDKWVEKLVEKRREVSSNEQ